MSCCTGHNCLALNGAVFDTDRKPLPGGLRFLVASGVAANGGPAGVERKATTGPDPKPFIGGPPRPPLSDLARQAYGEAMKGAVKNAD